MGGKRTGAGGGGGVGSASSSLLSSPLFPSRLLSSLLFYLPLPASIPMLHPSLPPSSRTLSLSSAVNQAHPSSSHTTGLASYAVNLEAQTADVYTDSVPFDAVLDKIKKTGKTVRGAEADGKGMGV